MTWTPIVPIPDDAPKPPSSHPRRNQPVAKYLYFTPLGEPAGWVYEYTKSTGEPLCLPLCWAIEAETGDRMWRWISMPEPRPLYRAIEIPAYHLSLPDGEPAPWLLVLPCEADADAAAAALAGMDSPPACVAWAGGPGCALKADWSPARALRVALWPAYLNQRKALSASEQAAGIDPASKPFLKPLHQPGLRAAGKAAELLTAQGCACFTVDLPLPGEKMGHWGIRDVIASGLSGQDLWDWLEARLSAFVPKTCGTDKPLPAAASQPDGGEAGGDPPAPVDACAVRVNSSEWSWLSRRIMDNDKPVDCRENVYLYLSHHPDLKGIVGADTFAKKMLMRKPAPWVNPAGFVERPWAETDGLQLGLFLVEKDRLLVRAKSNIEDAVMWAAAENSFNPVTDYLDGLQWDGQKRIDYWLHHYLGVEKTPYTTLCARYFLIGIVARMYSPGCKMRTMPIFLGKQYKGKSEALRILASPWFADTPLDFENKDLYLSIQGRMIYEVSELEGFSKASINRMKALISSSSDFFRAPYDRVAKDNPRSMVFAATTNEYEFLRDKTGNTRYWPLRTEAIGKMDLEGLVVARDQLFAEAVQEYRAGKHWWPSPWEQESLFEAEQEDAEIVDPMEQIISAYLHSISKHEVTLAEIMMDGLKITSDKIAVNRPLATAVGIAVRRLGWEKVRKMDNGKRTYAYLRPKTEQEALMSPDVGRLGSVEVDDDGF